MERLRTEQPRGLTRSGLRKWGMLFVALGVFGRSILQNRFLGVAGLNNDQLLNVISAGPEVMFFATIAIVLQFLETCAAPIYGLLLAEGYAEAADPLKYIGRVLGIAVISEIPYNLAMSSSFFDIGSRNPVFGLVMSLVLIYLYGRYPEKKISHILIKALVTLAAIIWCKMLSIDSGECLVIITAVFWAVRGKPMIRTLAGGAAVISCGLFSIYYMGSPMGMLVIHFYNGEKGEENRWLNDLFYPALLILMGIAGFVAFAV